MNSMEKECFNIRFKSRLLTLICAMALTLPATSCTGSSKPEDVSSDRKNLQIYVSATDRYLNDAIKQYNSLLTYTQRRIRQVRTQVMLQ